jgi:cytochrome c-type biogenesis protein CcmH/NrfF
MTFMLYMLLLAVAPQTAQDQELQKFYSEVWSPYCKGNSLLECPSGQADKLRQKIRLARESGRSFENIRAELEQEYQQSLRMTPQSGVRGKLAYAIPWLALMAILIVLVFYWRARVRPQGSIKVRSSQPLPHDIQNEIEERMR